MKAVLDMEPGAFYSVPGGHFLPVRTVLQGTTAAAHSKLPVSCMFDIYVMVQGTDRVGFFFATRFNVENHGGYLITTLQSKARATSVETLIKTDDLVVYNYPNRGTIAITPLVSDVVDNIFNEQ